MRPSDEFEEIVDAETIPFLRMYLDKFLELNGPKAPEPLETTEFAIKRLWRS